MNRYELTYIIDTTLEDSARKELIEKISSLIAANGGEVEKVDETWGKRRLAYAIDHKTEGYYVLVTMTAPAEAPKEIERNLRINDNVLRYLTVKLVEKQSKVKPRAVKPARGTFSSTLLKRRNSENDRGNTSMGNDRPRICVAISSESSFEDEPVRQSWTFGESTSRLA